MHMLPVSSGAVKVKACFAVMGWVGVCGWLDFCMYTPTRQPGQQKQEQTTPNCC